MLDIYIPENAGHPTMRIRKQGTKCVITKKQPDKADASVQTEETLALSTEEYASLSRQVAGKRVGKMRYYYDHGGIQAEIDLFSGPLYGLGMADFEFSSTASMGGFSMPDYCLAEVSQLDTVAGGLLAGKNYEDIEEALHSFGYQKLTYDI